MATNVNYDGRNFSPADFQRIIQDLNELRAAREMRQDEMRNLRGDVGILKVDKADRDRQFMIVGAAAGGAV